MHNRLLAKPCLRRTSTRNRPFPNYHAPKARSDSLHPPCPNEFGKKSNVVSGVFMAWALAIFLLCSSPAQAEDEKECPYNVQEVQRLCMDGIYDSPVGRRQCYRRHENTDCRNLFAECVKNCAFTNQKTNASGTESPYGRLLFNRIEKEIENLECERDDDCGAVILLDERGCKTSRPVSFVTVNENKLGKLLTAYNKYREVSVKEAGGNNIDCGDEKIVKSRCATNPLTEEKLCAPTE